MTTWKIFNYGREFAKYDFRKLLVQYFLLMLYMDTKNYEHEGFCHFSLQLIDYHQRQDFKSSPEN